LFTPTSTTKRALREQLVAARSRLDPHDRAALARRICERVRELEAFARARTLALYAVVGAEVDPATLGSDAVAAGKRVAYPRLVPGEQALRFSTCAPSALVPGALRTLQPPPGSELVAPGEIDLVLVPGLAFDLSCRRLGRGRGHYDATLVAMPRADKIGLAFELQIVPEVPSEEHDVALDAVVTEDRVLSRSR
jgi:5-formyltetrahydrofolate cyclo-ligase